MTQLPELIYFSSVSGNTARFADKLTAWLPALEARRLPLRRADPDLTVTRPFVLLTPTYGGGGENGGEVPRQVIRFLNNPANRDLMLGVLSCGNTNFGTAYCAAGDVIAAKCDVPHLDRIEVFGTPEDVERVAGILATLPQGEGHTTHLGGAQ
ncbi:class Ib ribonucleoside-diphosphate reductase assembly flavoprotein NrdI [Microbacterium sp. 77mftsu3.1]|uniref:class Ib ribonucleoside-diphosphate reductase assembly flavoprotein NrdI n=1 Tax=Microbacterium sp. 77mftsu3.1 TaxID=1761802 RepID=UPI0003714AE7|nr:class Ib ribonucleoside-diphosphate reductase assembly flavoprotein NrdI [Microbacterium sp. 77mftsu3.1]SDH42364.1 protein involved in ribonucleotide reduction [Microbacterium sp. 77mftsu3.1]